MMSIACNSRPASIGGLSNFTSVFPEKRNRTPVLAWKPRESARNNYETNKHLRFFLREAGIKLENISVNFIKITGKCLLFILL